MISIVNKDVFKQALTNSARFISHKISSSPVLQGALLKPQGEEMMIQATNLNEFFSTSVPAQTKNPQEILIDPKTVIEYLSVVNEEEIELATEEGGLKITAGKNHTTIPVIDGNEFPPTPNIKGGKSPASESFIKGSRAVLFSTSKDEGRPHLTGVNISKKGDTTILATTDGFRMSVFEIKEKLQLPNITVSNIFLNELIRVWEEKNQTLLWAEEEEKLICFKSNKSQLSSRFIEGEFPPFEKAIPTSHKIRASFLREEAEKAVKLAIIGARGQTNTITFEFNNGGLNIKPKSTDGRETVSFVPTTNIEGEVGKIAFNSRFIIDFLSNIKSKEIIFEATGVTAPCVFKSSEDDEFIHIIMPLRTEE